MQASARAIQKHLDRTRTSIVVVQKRINKYYRKSGGRYRKGFSESDDCLDRPTKDKPKLLKVAISSIV